MAVGGRGLDRSVIDILAEVHFDFMVWRFIFLF